MATLELAIEGRPYAKGRPRFDRRNGRAFTPLTTRQYESHVALEAYRGMIAAGVRPFAAGALRVELELPSGLTGDLDNYAKAVLDGLQTGFVIGNDRQVRELLVRVDELRARDTGVRVRISTL